MLCSGIEAGSDQSRQKSRSKLIHRALPVSSHLIDESEVEGLLSRHRSRELELHRFGAAGDRSNGGNGLIQV
jgi:hypothetical protein